MRNFRSSSSVTVVEHEKRRLQFAETTLKANLKGLGNGIALFCLVALGQVIFYLFSPTWLSLRTDAGRSQCWRNDGILRSGVHSGHGSECPDPHSIKSTSFCDTDPDSELCQATQSAAIFSMCNMTVLVACLVLYLLHRHPRVQDAISLFLFLSLLSMALGIATMHVMLNSPLFSETYLSQLKIGDDGRKHYGTPFSGFASCSFDTPFARPSTLLRSSVFRCVFPGMAALVACLQVLTSFVAFVFSWIYIVIRKRHKIVCQAIEEYNRISTFSPGPLDPSILSKLEEFSIFGEFERRFKHRNKMQRFILITFIPCALAAIQGCTLFAYLLNGISIVTEIVVKVQVPKENSPVKEVYRDELNVFNFSPLTATSFFWESHAELIAIASFASIAILPLIKLVIWVYFIFVPSRPITRSRALFIADTSGKFQLANLYMLTLVSLGMSFARHFSFPATEKSMTPFDFEHMADLVEFHGLHLPHVFVETRTSMNPGIGSWMFEVTFVASLLFGQMLISANLSACEWHERAKRKATGLTSQLEQVEDHAGGDDALYRAERDFRPYDWTEDETQDDMLQLIHPLCSTSSTPMRYRRYGSSFGEENLTFTSPRRSNLSRRSSITSLHPHVLALCDRTLYPQKGVRLKFTTKGKMFIISGLLIDGVLLLVSQFVNIFEIHVAGLFGMMKGSAITDHSLVSVVSTLAGSGGLPKLVDIAILFIVTICVAPTLRLFGMMFLWLLPLTLRGKRLLLHGLEILSAWASLDVFLFSLVMLFFGMESSTRQLIAESIPEMSKVMHFWLPPSMSDLNASIHPSASGFTLVLIAVVFDKFMAHVVFEQAVASIAERIADETLNEAVVAVSTASAIPEGEEVLDHEMLGDGLMECRTVRLPSEEEIIDTAEGILETDAVTYFGPVERYMSALMPSKLYAGFPRGFWIKVAKSAGFVDDAEAVVTFNDIGEVLREP